MLRWLTIVRLRLSSLLNRDGAERDLDDELRFHVEQATEQYINKGMPPHEARRISLTTIGSVESRKEEIRQARGLAWTLDVVVQDLRYGFRTLIKARGLTTTAILSLALGIGANAIVFSVVSATLLAPLPYPESDRLVRIWSIEASQPAVTRPATAPEYWTWKTESSLVEAMGTMYQGSGDLAGDGAEATPERVTVQGFTPSVFDVLKIRMQLGRAFRENEAAVDHEAPVVLISDGLWQRRFHRDSSVINRTVRLDGEARTIIGVMPAGFSFDDARSVDVWRPYALNSRQLRGSVHGFRVTARLKPGVSVRQLQSELDRITVVMTKDFPEREKGWTARVEDLHEALYGNLRQPLMLLQGVVGLVLLIACANVAGLLLARGSTRTTEMAVRSAIGAGRGRIVRQLLTESVVLALIGGAAGVGIGALGLQALVNSVAGSFPQITTVALDRHVLLFTTAVSVLTGLTFGLWPALRAPQSRLNEALKASSRGANDSSGQQRLRSAMVMIQMALAFVLLVGSVLMIRSFLRIQANALGADPHDIVTFQVAFSQTRFQKGVGASHGFPMAEVSPIPSQTYSRIWERLQNLPGVRSAAGISLLPFSGISGVFRLLEFSIEGRPRPVTPDEQRHFSAAQAIVTPRFFETMNIPILRGRDFTTSDTVSAPWTMVINEAMVRRFWPKEDPLGRRVLLDTVDDEQPREIIGIVGDTLNSALDHSPEPMFYVLHNQQPVHNRPPYGWTRMQMNFLLKTQVPPLALIPSLRAMVRDIDPDRPLGDVRPLEQTLGETLQTPRNTAAVLTVFAAAATFLAAIGIYGVLAFGVAQRTREIGIRMALGAGHWQVLTLVLRETAVIVGAALLFGVGAALFASRLLTSALWGITATDVPTYMVVCAVLMAVALAAALVPARRAVSVPPTVALRQE